MLAHPPRTPRAEAASWHARVCPLLATGTTRGSVPFLPSPSRHRNSAISPSAPRGAGACDAPLGAPSISMRPAPLPRLQNALARDPSAPRFWAPRNPSPRSLVTPLEFEDVSFNPCPKSASIRTRNHSDSNPFRGGFTGTSRCLESAWFQALEITTFHNPFFASISPQSRSGFGSDFTPISPRDDSLKHARVHSHEAAKRSDSCQPKSPLFARFQAEKLRIRPVFIPTRLQLPRFSNIPLPMHAQRVSCTQHAFRPGHAPRI